MTSFFSLRTTDYGGDQEEYAMLIDKIANDASEQFHKVVDSKGDLIDLFNVTLERLAKERARIAEKNKTDNFQMFGVRRDLFIEGPCMLTGLFTPYDQFNKKLLPMIQKQLSPMKRTVFSFEERERKYEVEKSLGRKSSIGLEIITPGTTKWEYQNNDYSFFIKICQLIGKKVPTEEEYDENNLFDAFISNLEELSLLKNKAPELYKQLKFKIAFAQIYNTHKVFKKSDWIVATVRLEISGKMYAMSQYITWAYRNHKEDPVEHMTNRSIIYLLHQDCFLIKDMLQEIAKVFKEVLEWNGKELEELKNGVALFEYLFAHTMPFQRGSAAISEMFEKAIYRFHGYKLSYSLKTNVNMEALTSPLPQFVKNYDSFIKLEKVESSSSTS